MANNDDFSLESLGIDPDNVPGDGTTLNYVFTKFLKIGNWKESPLGRALINEGCESIQDILTMSYAEIDALQWEEQATNDGHTTRKPVPKRDRMILQAFLYFIDDSRSSSGQYDITNDAIAQLSPDAFTAFRTRPLDRMAPVATLFSPSSPRSSMSPIFTTFSSDCQENDEVSLTLDGPTAKPLKQQQPCQQDDLTLSRDGGDD